jgi:hypothetical protein
MPPLDIDLLVKVAVIAFASVGLILFLWGLRRFWRRKVVSGSFEGLVGLLFVAIAGLIVAISMNLRTYDRLTHESPVAEVRFQVRGPQYFRAYMMLESGAKIFDLRGDEWQIDARVLKWRGPAVLLGLDTLYRLDRLGGRYRDISQERTRPRTIYSLSKEPGLDLWTIVQKYTRWMPWMDALYGSATYMPMVDGASYSISLSSSGLVARPSNEIARKAVGRWR